MWKSLQEIIPKAAGKYDFTQTLKAIEVCQEYRSIAKKILSPDALENTFPKSYKEGNFTIAALNSAWAAKIQQNKHRIHQSLQKKFGETSIRNIKIEIAEKLPTDISEK